MTLFGRLSITLLLLALLLGLLVSFVVGEMVNRELQAAAQQSMSAPGAPAPLPPSIAATAQRVRAHIILISLITTGVAAAILLIVAGRMTLPLRRLMEAMRAFGAGESTELRLPPGSGLEIERLVETFNAMTRARRQLEAELRESEQRFSQIFTQSPVGMMVFDDLGRLLATNPASLRLLGLEDPPLEQAGDGVFELLQLSRQQQERMRAGELLRYECQLCFGQPGPLRNSRRREPATVQVSVAPLRWDGQERPVQWLAQLQDVTAEMRMLQELRAARERAEQYLDVAGVMLLALEPDGTVALINRRGSEILGYPEEQIRGRDWFEHFVPERERERLRAVHAQILAGARGERAEGEGPVACADGSERLIAWITSLLRDPQGRVVGTLSSGQDVTEHRRAEAELRASEQRFRTLVEAMRDALAIVSAEGLITYANPAACELLGYSFEELVGRHVTGFLADETSAATFAAQWRARIEEGAGGTYEMRVRSGTGRIVPIAVSASALRDASGKVTGSLTAFRDITAQTAALEALRESEQRYRALADSLPQIVFEADAQGRLNFTNRYARQRLGYEGESGPASALEMIAAADRPRARTHLRRLLHGESVGPAEYQIITADGEVFPAVMHADPIRRGPQVVGMRGIIFDLTEVKRAEAEIARLNEFRQNVIDSANVWVTVADADGRVLLWNRAAERSSGYPREEVMGKTSIWQRLIPDNDQRQALFAMAEAVLAGQPVEAQETRLRRSDGEEIIVEWSARPLRSLPGEKPALVVLGRDVTESRRLSRQIEWAQRMDAVGRLAGAIAHDFNNLLSAIMGHLGMLLRALPPHAPERRHAEQIDVAVRQAATMTRQLLTFSRREPLTTELYPLDLNQVVNGLRALVQPLLSPNITLRVHLDPNLPAVRAAAGEMQQVLMNLIINARDAMPAGGELTITTRVLEASAVPLPADALARARQWARLSVADTGQGMDEETRAHIFEPFFTTKPDGEGTGLGLSTVYRVVQSLGGTVEVHSAVGQGTVFDLYLPGCAAAEAAALRPALTDQDLRGTETVLVAEDEDVLRELFRVMLEDFGYRPLVAPDGETALELARRHRAELDLLVADILMPGMNGVQLAQRLQEEIPGLPVVFISGYAGALVVQGERFDPGEALLHKPFTLDELLVAIRRALAARPSHPDQEQ